MNFESESMDDETGYDGGELEPSDDGLEQPEKQPQGDDHESEQAAAEPQRDEEIAHAPTEPSTDFSAIDSAAPETAPEPKPRIPRAGTAFVAFTTFFIAQVVVSIAVAIGAAVAGLISYASLGLKPEESDFFDLIMQSTLYSVVPISIIAGFSVLLVTRWLARDAITDGEVTGVGWVKSSPMRCLAGAVLGAVIYLATIFLVRTLFPNLEPESGGPIEAMAKQGGIMLLLLVIGVVVFAPLVEEFLFRGVMLAGFTRSFGLPVAVFFCTSLFVMVHLDAIMRYTPGVIPLTGLALGAVFVRIKFKSVWPAIAAHFGYNGMAVLLPMFYQLFSSGE